MEKKPKLYYKEADKITFLWFILPKGTTQKDENELQKVCTNHGAIIINSKSPKIAGILRNQAEIAKKQLHGKKIIFISIASDWVTEMMLDLQRISFELKQVLPDNE